MPIANTCVTHMNIAILHPQRQTQLFGKWSKFLQQLAKANPFFNK